MAGSKHRYLSGYCLAGLGLLCGWIGSGSALGQNFDVQSAAYRVPASGSVSSENGGLGFIKPVGFFQRKGRTASPKLCAPEAVPADVEEGPPAVVLPPAGGSIPPVDGQILPVPVEAGPATVLPPVAEEAAPLIAVSAPAAVAPNMLGDYIGVVFQIASPVSSNSGTVLGGLTTTQEIAQERVIKRYKVADFTSPIPTTRVMYSFNYFQNAFTSNGEVYRHFAAAELAFFDRMASVEIRTSVNSFDHFPDDNGTTDFGDLRTTFKGVLYQNPSTVVSGGLAIGWPTGPLPAGVQSSFYFSPFIGYLFGRRSDWYFQGFEQIDFPTQSEDQVLLHTDVGLGYWVYRAPAGTLTGIATTAELHLYTPLGRSPTGSLSNLVLNDVCNTTIGALFFLRNRVQLALGVGFPISAKNDYDYEVQAHIQWSF